MSKLHVALLGNVRVAYDGKPQDDRLTRGLQKLLSFLLVQRHRRHPREVLAGLFWGESTDQQARVCLSTALYRLRQVLEPDGVERGTYLITTPLGEIGFNAQSDYWLDIALFEEQATAVLAHPIKSCEPCHICQLENAIELYCGELLEGYFDDWALQERERFRLLYLRSLTYLVGYHRHRGDYEQGLAYGQAILRVDPLREEIHRELMRMYLANGQPSLALNQFDVCRRALADELGVDPMEETRRVYADILASRNDTSPEVGAYPQLEPQGEFQLALDQLATAMRTLESAHDQLKHAIQVVERYAEERVNSLGERIVRRKS